MKVTVESTDTFRKQDGTYYRLWKGKDAKGQNIALWVLGMSYQSGSDESEAEKDLREIPMTGLEQTIVCTRKDIGP